MAKEMINTIKGFSKSGDLNILNKLTGSQKINIIGSTLSGLSGYKRASNEGRGFVGAAAQAVVDGALTDIIGFKAAIAGSILMAAPKGAVHAYEGMSRQAREMSRMGSAAPFQNSTFIDSEQVYTMRQAGMNMAAQSKNNVKTAVLGSEAQYLHR